MGRYLSKGTIFGNLLFNWQNTVMTVTVDKFGRILIPKRAREIIGLRAGDRLELEVSPHDRSIDLHPSPETAYPKVSIETTDWGWPVIHYLDNEVRDFDPVELIKEGREERDRKLFGQDD